MNILTPLGAICIIAAIVGGGLKAIGFIMPIIGSIRRQILLASFGVILLLLGEGVTPLPSQITSVSPSTTVVLSTLTLPAPTLAQTDIPRSQSTTPAPPTVAPTVASISPTLTHTVQASNTSTPIPPTSPLIVSPTVIAVSSPCPARIGVISQESDWRRVVLEPDGRIWQDMIQGGNEPYEVAFYTPCSGRMERLFNGINAALLLNDQIVAGGENGKPVTLLPGTRYTVRGGRGNGGFSLELVR